MCVSAILKGLCWQCFVARPHFFSLLPKLEADANHVVTTTGY